MTVYLQPSPSGAIPVYTLNETEGSKAVTLVLPSLHAAKEREDGSLCIVLPNGQEVTELETSKQTCRPGFVYIDPKTGKETRTHCDVLDPSSFMRIMAYRTDHVAEKRRMAHSTWSIHKQKNAEPVPVYLPRACKLVVCNGKTAIHIPSGGVAEVRTFRKGPKSIIPPRPIIKEDFDGVTKNGLPNIKIGSKYRPCLLVEETDIYELPPRSQSVLRLEEALWQIDSYRPNPKTGVARIERTFSEEPPQKT